MCVCCLFKKIIYKEMDLKVIINFEIRVIKFTFETIAIKSQGKNVKIKQTSDKIKIKQGLLCNGGERERRENCSGSSKRGCHSQGTARVGSN